MLNSQKIMKITSTVNFETPNQIFLPHGVELFLGKIPTHNNVAPELIACGQKFGGREAGWFKASHPPPPFGSYTVNKDS